MTREFHHKTYDWRKNTSLKWLSITKYNILYILMYFEYPHNKFVHTCLQ